MPIRHATEITNLIKVNGLMLSKHVLVIVSDGGPDHRVTFGSVQVSSLTLFRSLDLDMLICVRTCPYQSWTNIAERIMSTLNLALQNVSLARTSMGEHAESMVKNASCSTTINLLHKIFSWHQGANPQCIATVVPGS